MVTSTSDTPAQKPPAPPYPVAWVLSSGGPRGFVHVGVLKALFELGLRPNLVLGSSVGALVGCLAAAGVAMPRIEALALETSMASLFRLNFSGDLWFNGAGLADLVNAEVAGQRLQQFATPFAAVAMRRGHTHAGGVINCNTGSCGTGRLRRRGAPGAGAHWPARVPRRRSFEPAAGAAGAPDRGRCGYWPSTHRPMKTGHRPRPVPTAPQTCASAN